MQPNQDPNQPTQQNVQSTNTPYVDAQHATLTSEHQAAQDARATPMTPAVSEADALEYNLSLGEHVLYTIKRHPIGLVQFYLSTIVGVIAVLAFLALFIDGKSEVGLTHIPDSIGVLVAVVVIGFLGLVNIVAIKIYNKNSIVLTNESLIVEKQQGLFGKHRKVLSLETVEDISFDQTTVLQHLFNFATLKIATVGKDSVVFTMTQNAKTAADQIENAREQLIEAQDRRRVD